MIGEVRKRVTDINTELTISLFSAYGAFVPADQLGVSGVLAVVACGVYLGFRAPEIASPESRMQAYGAVVDPSPSCSTRRCSSSSGCSCR